MSTYTRGKVLVAGGRGYVGSRIAAFLASRGWHVVVGSRSGQSLAEHESLGIKAVALDWQSPESLTTACDGCDAVLHLAAPNEMIAGNSKKEAVCGTILTAVAMLDAARTSACSRFIYFSTAHVYGSPLSGSLDEDRQAFPTHPYAITHRCAEDFVLAEPDSSHLRTAVIRLSNALGAPLHPETDRWKLIGNDLCRQAVTEGCLTLQSTGTALRDFIPIQDVSRAIEHLLELADLPSNPLFNVASGNTRSLASLAELVASRWKARTGQSLEIKYGTHGGSAPEFQIPVTKLISTGFSFESSLEAEIDLTLERCQQWFANSP